jgi:hypothetical protein
MKKNKEINPEDSIRLVRIAIKCADLLPDYDILSELMEEKKSKYIKHELKDMFITLGFGVDKFSSAFLKPFVEADENTQKDLQQMFRELTDKIWFINKEMTTLVTLYSKTKSIHNDLMEMEFVDGPISYIKEICNDFCKEVEKKYKPILSKVDKEGHGVADVVEAFSKLGKTIMYS